MYLTYDDYLDMGGTIEDETTFDDFAFEAECIINWYTFDRLKNDNKFDNNVKRCMYALIKLAQLKAAALASGSGVAISSGSSTTTDGVQSQVAAYSNDGVSVSYNILSASEVFNALSATTKGSEVDNLIKRYLQGVVNSLGRKVLYRGVYPDE